MTGRAVALRVAAHARRDVSFRFPGMVPRSPRRIRPHRLWWVKAAPCRDIAERPGHRDPGALVAGYAKRAHPVAAGAGALVLTSGDGMKVEPVVRVDASRPHPAV